MPRLLSTLLVVALLGGTAAAFAVTQGLKIEPSPILAPRVQKVFSPICDCATNRATIQFRLRKPDRVQVQIVNANGKVVRTLVPGTRLRSGTVTYTWNGRNDNARFVPEGVYKPRVHLTDQHRTIDLPNEMRVDETPPKPKIVSVAPPALSPDGDGHGDRVALRYRLSERAHAILFVDGTQIVFTRTKATKGTIAWNGKVHGKLLRPGPHLLRLGAEDPAGNDAVPTKPVEVVLRYVQLARNQIKARANTRFGVNVSADAPFHWRLGAKHGTGKPGLLVLRARAKAGRVPLVVTVGDHSARAVVIVEPRG